MSRSWHITQECEVNSSSLGTICYWDFHLANYR